MFALLMKSLLHTEVCQQSDIGKRTKVQEQANSSRLRDCIPQTSETCLSNTENNETLGSFAGQFDHRLTRYCGVEPICHILQIAPATFYAHLAIENDPDKASDRAKRNTEMHPEGKLFGKKTLRFMTQANCGTRLSERTFISHAALLND